MDRPLLFVFDDYADMVRELVAMSHLRLGKFQTHRFLNQELYIKLNTDVCGAECFVFGSLAPPDTNLHSFLLLCHTLKKEGAVKLTAILPYLAYSRHDKDEPKKSHGTAFIADLLASVGVDDIITFDIHSQHAERLFSIPLKSISPASLFGDQISSMDLTNVTLVSPDEGAVERCAEVAKASGIHDEIVYIKKSRTEDGVTHGALHGVVKSRAFIIDSCFKFI